MYSRILLAYDGTAEGVLALREGALLAKQCDAQIVLLAVVPDTSATRLAEGLYAGAAAIQIDTYKDLLGRALAWLEARGYEPGSRLVAGEPAQSIGTVAKEIDADLVVVGHHHRGFLSRWWSESIDTYLSDHLDCTLLIARNLVSEEAFDAALEAMAHRMAEPNPA